MTTFLLHPGVAPFTFALGLLCGLLAIETLMLAAAGHGPLGFLDSLDIDVDGGGFDQILGWLEVGRVPFLVVLAAQLTFFAVVGFALQAAAVRLLGAPVSGWIAAPAAFVVGLWPAKGVTRLVARFVPQEQTSAVSADSFIGRAAVVTQGTARGKLSAEARLTDEFGQNHYVRVVPFDEAAILPQGAEIVLVERRGGVFRAALMSDR